MPRAATGASSLMRWGFLPGFVKDPTDFPLLIKARAETLTERPSFRAAVRRRRCLVMADGGYYEWRRGDARGRDDRHVPRAPGRPRADRLCRSLRDLERSIRRRDRHRLHRHDAGQPHDRRPVHDRMPAIVAPDDHAAWLDNDGVEAAEAIGLLRPAPEGALEMVEIGNRVNRVGEYGPEVQEPLAGPHEPSPKA